MRKRRWMLGGAILLVAAFLAFLLRDVIQQTVILPLSYLWWVGMLFFRAIPQLFFWMILILGVTILALFSLIGRYIPYRPKAEESTHLSGAVEALAAWITKTRYGIYFKWLVAHRLGQLAQSIVMHREGQEAPPARGALVSRDWHPPEAVGTYLDAALNRSFTDFPRPRLFSPPNRTPFDTDLGQVVDYIESIMETNRDRRHP